MWEHTYAELNEQEKELIFSQICQKHAPVFLFMRSTQQIEQLIYWTLWDLKMSDMISPFKQRKGVNIRIKPEVSRYRNNLSVEIYVSLDSPNEGLGVPMTATVLESDLKFYKVEEKLRNIASYMSEWFSSLYTTCTFAFSITGPSGSFLRIKEESGKEVYTNSAW